MHQVLAWHTISSAEEDKCFNKEHGVLQVKATTMMVDYPYSGKTKLMEAVRG